MRLPETRLRFAVTLLTLAAVRHTSRVRRGSEPTATGPVARFKPIRRTRGANTVALAGGGSSGAAVSINITVTGVTDSSARRSV
jgi:hypothetical protein